MASFEWQFEDEHGLWVPYGKSGQGKDYSTTTTSSDIEKNFLNNPDKTPMLIESPKFQYVLDLEAMIQTNLQTSVKRKIRKVRSARNNPGSEESTKVGGNAWFFKDEHNRWIKYGETSPKNASSYTVSVSSSAIERQFKKDNAHKMNISSGNFKYVLDFEDMTQTNTSTQKERPIRRLFAFSEGGSDDNPTAGSNILPANWASMNNYVAVVRLDTSHREYVQQVALIEKTLSNQIINNVYRIQHKYLWTAYENRRNFLRDRFPGQVFQEKYLFHGTNKNNLKNIYTDNFDSRLYGTNVGNIYGGGTYFSNSAGYSADYCSGEPPKVMFIVRVLVGRIAKGNRGMVRPPDDSSGERCDTTVDDESSPTIFVKYDSQEYYPEYYFEFGLSEANRCTIL